jgi:hypothetical protein
MWLKLLQSDRIFAILVFNMELILCKAPASWFTISTPGSHKNWWLVSKKKSTKLEIIVFMINKNMKKKGGTVKENRSKTKQSIIFFFFKEEGINLNKSAAWQSCQHIGLLYGSPRLDCRPRSHMEVSLRWARPVMKKHRGTSLNGDRCLWKVWLYVLKKLKNFLNGALGIL